ncbi:MAG: hypothetical protein CM15mV124_340 [uncultured marine virus]|nr:MAG: hypothetical protein CM15mV124_340 [uncultured marine virus]
MRINLKKELLAKMVKELLHSYPHNHFLSKGNLWKKYATGKILKSEGQDAFPIRNGLRVEWFMGKFRVLIKNTNQRR